MQMRATELHKTAPPLKRVRRQLADSVRRPEAGKYTSRIDRLLELITKLKLIEPLPAQAWPPTVLA